MCTLLEVKFIRIKYHNKSGHIVIFFALYFQSNVFGVFGPTKKGSLQHIQSIADFLEIPHIITDPVETQNRNWSVVNMFPHHIAYSQVLA